MSNIKNIIFDFGGVILTDDDIGVMEKNEEFKSALEFDPEKLLAAWKNNWNKVGNNRVSVFEFYNLLQDEATGRHDEDLSKKMFEWYKKYTNLLPAFDLVKKLNEKYPLFALTNIHKEGLAYKKNKYNLDRYFKKIIASCDLGISKPDPEIFFKLLKDAGLNSRESLFIDDSEKNIKTAKDLGFEIYHYDNIQGLTKKLEELGVIYG